LWLSLCSWVLRLRLCWFIGRGHVDRFDLRFRFIRCYGLSVCLALGFLRGVSGSIFGRCIRRLFLWLGDRLLRSCGRFLLLGGVATFTNLLGVLAFSLRLISIRRRLFRDFSIGWLLFGSSWLRRFVWFLRLDIGLSFSCRATIFIAGFLIALLRFRRGFLSSLRGYFFLASAFLLSRLVID
jgi:hypothetical protein